MLFFFLLVRNIQIISHLTLEILGTLAKYRGIVFNTVAEIVILWCLALISHVRHVLPTSSYHDRHTRCLLFFEEFDSTDKQSSVCPFANEIKFVQGSCNYLPQKHRNLFDLFQNFALFMNGSFFEFSLQRVFHVLMLKYFGFFSMSSFQMFMQLNFQVADFRISYLSVYFTLRKNEKWYHLGSVCFTLATCARKPKPPGSSPAVSYLQRCFLCSN